jgi:recombinational DNA repair protein (RecF pathway)
MAKFIPFTHDCAVCGQPNAAWGLKVRMRYAEFGEWYCHEHYPHKEKFPIVVRPRGAPILPQRKPVQQSMQF